MLPLEVTLVPTFLIIHKFDWLNTYQGIAGPLFIDAFGVFLMRQFILKIPRDYLEAARLDGAGELRILWRIIIPQCRPALAVLAILLMTADHSCGLWLSSGTILYYPLGLVRFAEDYGNPRAVARHHSVFLVSSSPSRGCTGQPQVSRDVKGVPHGRERQSSNTAAARHPEIRYPRASGDAGGQEPMASADGHPHREGRIRRSTPVTPGHEFAGFVVALARESGAVGDRFGCAASGAGGGFCLRGETTASGLTRLGSSAREMMSA
jgi:hypothetical protein